MNKTQGTVALITDANKGIAFELARQFGERHIDVLVGAIERSRFGIWSIELHGIPRD